MKDPFNWKKVVLRHLPPAILQSALMDHIDGRFAGRYKWVSFRPGKNNQKNQRYSRAYIEFLSSEDVVEFAEFFDGHIFVNEKGAQFKALVEYAPSQSVPKAWSKKDGREGTIFQDPEYLEFLELLAKPVENLPSAEIQLEKREAERTGGPKETFIVTPLMDFVRRKRATKSGSQRSSANGKLSRRAGGASTSSSSPSSKRGSQKRRVSTSVYVIRDSTKMNSGKDKSTSTYMLVPRKEEQQLDKSLVLASTSGTDLLEDETVSGSVEIGKRLLLLKGKEREASQKKSVTASISNSPGTAPKQSQRNEASGRIIRSILSSKDVRQNQSYLAASQSEQQTQAGNLQRDKRPPHSPNICPILNDQITSFHRHIGRRGQTHGLKEVEGSINFPEGKHSKRGGSAGYGSHERQVWVQKSGSGS